MAVLGPFNFRGGYSPGHIFTTDPGSRGYASEMRNCRYSGGSVVPRWAHKQTNASTLGAGSTVNGMAVWVDAANSVTALVSACNAKLQTADITAYLPSNSAVTFTDRTGAVTLSGSATVRYSFDSLNNILVGSGNSTGSGVPFQMTAYNANIANLSGSPPSADCVKQVNNFLFLSRNLSSSTLQSRVYWSNVSDPQTWTAANFVDFNKNDGEPIMALGSIGTDLYIFKKRTIGRLSTTTLTISGAVTLGPLTTVIRGMGCIGPFGVDNLPNGNIVFLGIDGHLYEFDGASISDVSRTPDPGPNAYDPYLGLTSAFPGLMNGVIDPRSTIKTWRGIDEVWVAFDTSDAGNGYTVFAWNYKDRIWAGTIWNILPKSFATSQLPAGVSNIYESNEILFHGNSNGLIFAHGDPTKPFPVDEAITPVDFRLGTSISVSKEGEVFTPRSICFELPVTHASLTTAGFYITFDTFFSGGTANWSTTGASAVRAFVNVPIKIDSSGSQVFPTILTVEWIFQGSGSPTSEVCRIGNFYISDEIMR